MTRKAIAILLSVLSVLLVLSGCGKKTEVPETSSRQYNVYMDNGVLVNENGTEAKGFTLNKDGHLIRTSDKEDKNPEILAASWNIEKYTTVTEVHVSGADTEQKVPVYLLSDGSKVTKGRQATLVVRVSPETAVNKNFTLYSSDTSLLDFNGADHIVLNGTGAVKVECNFNAAGNVILKATDAKGEVVEEIIIRITATRDTDPVEVAKAEADVKDCTHSYRVEVVPSTEFEEGYTLHSCLLCGHEYTDNYTAKLDCQHTYSEREVPATCAERGYTLRTCTKCGKSEKSEGTGALGAHTFRDEIVKPTCTERGYTKHVCTVCGAVMQDTFVAATGHKYTDEIIYPSCTEEGYTRRTCSVCGVIDKVNPVPRIPHTYIDTVVAPTSTEQGYTQHTCRVCGFVTKDNYTQPTGCAVHSYVDTVLVQPTCTTPGTVRRLCSVCGHTVTESLPTAGHRYAENVVPPTATEQGYTQHTCVLCGFTYKDTYLPPRP